MASLSFIVIYLGVAVALVLVYGTYLALQRLVLSPIAHVPGPKLAALSFWYEFYYDVIKPGQYTWKIRELHDQYGPIIRINPYEIHINDPDFYDQLYVGTATRRTDKWAWSVQVLPLPDTIVTTVHHGLHRHRRMALAPHFSAAAMQRLEPKLREIVHKLCLRLDQAAQTGKTIRVDHAFSAMSIDAISYYTFGKSYDFLDAPDFKPGLHQIQADVGTSFHVGKHLPWLRFVVATIPSALASSLFPSLNTIVEWQTKFEEDVKEVIETRKATDSSENYSLMRNILGSDSIPPEEKAPQRLRIVAMMLLFAGAFTTSHALTTLCYHMIVQPDIQAKLRHELSEVAKYTTDGRVESIPLKTLQAQPYLTAVIRETLRVSVGIAHRLQRISPDVPLQYSKYIIPAGTPVSMSAILMHRNPDVFPDPDRFDPERWLPLETKGQQVNKYLVAFNRGSRSCLGVGLAKAELYLAAAAVFGRERKLDLIDTDYERDVKLVRDGFVPMPTPASQGVQVSVKVAVDTNLI